MKTKIIVFQFLFLSISLAYSQESPNNVIFENQKTIGKLYETQSEIRALEYVFPERIHHIYIDSIFPFFTIQLRDFTNSKRNYLKNNGKVIVFDPTTKKAKWEKKINYLLGEIHQSGSSMIQTINNKSYYLNIYNGQELWEIKNNIYFIDSKFDIGIGYKIKGATGFTNTLEAIDLKSGTVKWQKEINREYSWNDAFYLNDSTLLIVAAGLHSLNLKDGNGWSYHTITGKKDYKETVATNVAGVALGLLTGSFLIATGHNLIRDVVSNVAIDSTSIYFASMEKISKIDKQTGVISWTAALPSKNMSKSSIFENDNTIILINKGFAYMGNRKIEFGDPFMAAFDKNTGKQLYSVPIAPEKDQVVAYGINDTNTVQIITNSNVTNYSLIDGSIINFKNINNTELGNASHYVGKQVYIKTSDTTMACLPMMNESKNYIIMSKNKIIEMDNDFTISNQISMDDIYILYEKLGEYKFVAKENLTYILDKDNNIVGEIEISRFSYIVNGAMFTAQNKSLLEINLKDFLQQ